jgi:predicted dehydrogenase
MNTLIQNRKIRWGIIGLGNIAHKFASDLLTVQDAELYAVASRNQEKANTFAKQYNAKKAYDSYKALVNDVNIDAIYIATPHSFHKAHTLLCIEKGIAVLCEKPFAMHSHEVAEMVACAKANKVLLMEALWTYFLPHYQFALQKLKNKTYGNILKMEADFGFKPEFNAGSRVFNKSLGGGSLLDIGIYPIFAALSALGIPKTIEANATYFENGVDSSCSILFNYKNNAQAILKSTFLETTPTEAIFYCEKATIKVNSRFHGPSNVSIIIDGQEELFDFNYSTSGYSYEIIHFNQLLKEGKTESDIMTFDFSLQLMQTLDKVRESVGLEY